MALAGGWTLFEHPEFTRQREQLEEAVKALRTGDPVGWRDTADAKLLAAIARLTLEIIPADPGAPQFRQGGTLGKARRHWFRAKFGNGRYRLFYQFNSTAKVIIYTWVNDAKSLRTYGARRDAYAVFEAMLDKGNPPDSWSELAEAVGAGERKGGAEKGGRKKRRQ
jgi:toxin YhaV